jgi:2-oxo-4-hydroxy-4-carboxy--5-ureidoimidazoline (OHCU) decarboxylase
MPIEELDALPRAEFVAAIEPLFEGAPALVARLAGDRPFGSWWNLLARARVVAQALPEPERIELLNSHPRLGAPPESVSRLSFEEQGYDRVDEDRAIESGPAPAAPTPAPPAVPHAPALSSTGLRSRLEHLAAAGAERPTWGSAASAGAAPTPPSSMPAPIVPAAAPSPTPPPPVVDDDSTHAKLARLNAAYEDWFGFRYCVFVAGRPLESLVPELEKAMAQSREHEIQRGVDAVIDIAIARSGMAR